MVDTTRTPRHPNRILRTGVLLALIVTAIDLIGLITFGLPNAPLEVNLVTSILIVATIIGSVWAWRGAAWGVWLAAIARVLAALSVVPLLVNPEAPREAIPTSLVVLVLTIVVVVLLFVGLGRRRAA